MTVFLCGTCASGPAQPQLQLQLACTTRNNLWPRSTPCRTGVSASGTTCDVGASLARLEIKLFFEHFLEKVAAIERVTDAPHVEMPNAFVFGLRESHIALTPG